MSGETVTQKRPMPGLGPYRVSTGAVGYPADHIDEIYISGGFQETTSYRTGKGSEDEQAELKESLRIFRNGFTTNDPVFDRGHEFITTKQTVTTSGPLEVYLQGTNRIGVPVFYRGPLLPRLSYDGTLPGGLPVAAHLSDNEAVDLGQRAILNCAPTAPQASAAVFIGELFESLPSMVGAALWKSKCKDYREVGSEYLNIQFGWVPFLNDLRKMASALKQSTKILRQLQHDNGRVVRRRFRFPTKTDQSINTFTGMYGDTHWPLLSTRTYCDLSSAPEVTVWDRTERSSWFSGAFSYCIPTDSDLWSKLEKYDSYANVLLGSRVTPETVWQLAPWSWLVDWKFGVGQAISAAQRFSSDGLVIRYGYLMSHAIREIEYSAPPLPLKGGGMLPVSFTTLRGECKERRQATPYGFGLSTDDLSDFQWSILAALGMNRGPRRLA